MALSRARSSRHLRLACYESGMRDELARRLASERRLRRAIASGRVEVFYQPVVGLADQAVHGAEALARLRDEDGTIVLPDQFIPLAEELGLIRDLGHAVLEIACRETVQAGALVGHRLRVAVNLAADQLTPELPAEVAQVLAASGLDGDLLTLELTESTLADESASTQRVLGELRALGVWVSLDDFGTGYSSMSYLATLPVAGLKIDRSFVTVLGTSAHGLTLARMVVQLAASLGLSTVAEGIETTEQADLLRGMGCDYGQGYLYARPMPFDEYLTFLRGPILHVPVTA
jgi:EAL domain-containing protein (putative c-di-GMP-specific phosphodiesterase class I)